MEAKDILGQHIPTPEHYNPDVLVAVPRSENRQKCGIRPQLFSGLDIWHAYEASFLLDNGMPFSGILKLAVPSTSENIVESKSLKLYLASFNMERMGSTVESAARRLETTVMKDLLGKAGVPATCRLHPLEPATRDVSDFIPYLPLEDLLDTGRLSAGTYEECPSLLEEDILPAAGEIKVCSRLLRSNCKITHQPDWGTVYIRLSAKRLPAYKSLLRYIVSFRNEYHFHEEICEIIYQRLHDLFTPDKLMVACVYTRRGGINICPVRANTPELLPPFLCDLHAITDRSFR